MEQEVSFNICRMKAQSRSGTSVFLKRIVLCVAFFIVAFPVVGQTRMYPLSADWLKEIKFETKLPKGFGVDRAYKFVYLVCPIFSEEYCLTYDSIKRSLVLCKSKSKIGYALSKRESELARKMRVKSYLLPVDDEYVDSLQSLYCAILNAVSPNCRKTGLDGVSYYFYLPIDVYTVAFAWSPDEESNCGRTVRLMEQLCDAVEKHDLDAAEQLREEIVALTAVFRRLPPEFYVH